MRSTDSGTAPSWATVTHARLRASQGDAATARELLRDVLARDPEAPGARPLLDRLCDLDATERAARIERLTTWLRRIRHES